MNSKQNAPPKIILSGALLVFILLLSIYWLTYSGVPISDDEQLYAVVAQNLAVSGEFRADQLLGNQRLHGRYGNIGPLHPLIAAQLVKLVWPAKSFGAVQTVYLLPPIYTALTAALLYAYARHKRFSHHTASFAALAFGLATMAWPYAQTFYREPLAMLLLFGAFFLFEGLTGEIPFKLHPLPGWLIFSLCLLGAVLTKVYILLILPLFLVKIVQKRELVFPKKWNSTVVVVLLGITVILFLFASAEIFDYSRLSIDFMLHIWRVIKVRAGEFDLLATAANLGAILFSPSKGFLIYSPLLVVVFVRSLRVKRHNCPKPLLPVGIFLIFLLTQTLTYQAEWWSISWSTRFLLPVIPLLLAAGLPGIEDALTDTHQPWKKIVLWAGTLLGFIIQLGGVLISDSLYLDVLYNQWQMSDLSETLWRIDLMPAFQHWRLALSGSDLNLALVRNFQFFPPLVSILIVILLGTAGFAAASLLRPSENSNMKSALMLGAYSILILPALMLIAYRFEPGYFPVWGNLNQASETISTQAQPGDIVIVDGYQRPAWYQIVNHGRFSQSWASLPENPQYWPEVISAALENAAPDSRLWFLVENERFTSTSFMLEYPYRLELNCNPIDLFTEPNTPSYYLFVCEY